MKIIALSGKAESGKNYYAQEMRIFLQSSYNERVCTIAFGDILKYTLSRYFGWNGEKDKAGREMLQKLGTELRKKTNPDVWINITCELIKYMSDEFDWFIITDLRFSRELTALQMRFENVYPVRIERFAADWDAWQENSELGGKLFHPYCNKLSKEQKQHPSETELDDYKGWYEIIYNYTNDYPSELSDICMGEPMLDIFKLINRIKKEQEQKNESI